MQEVTDLIRRGELQNVDIIISDGDRYFQNNCPDCGALQLFVVRNNGTLHLVKSVHQ